MHAINLSYGRMWLIDADGFIVNDADDACIMPPFRAAVDALVAAYREYLGTLLHSVYVRGTVARGVAVPGVSDLDTFAFTHADPDTLDLAPLAAAAQEIKSLHPAISDLGPVVLPLAEIADTQCFNEITLEIQTQSACVWGEDRAPMLPRFKPDVIVANNDICQIGSDVDAAIAELKANAAPDHVRRWCRRIAKNMIRAGFSLVMLHEHGFTRDLVPCVQAFVKHYPQQAPYMFHALELALNPLDKPRRVLHFVQDFGAWLTGIADVWLDRHNPARVLALPLNE